MAWKILKTLNGLTISGTKVLMAENSLNEEGNQQISGTRAVKKTWKN